MSKENVSVWEAMKFSNYKNHSPYKSSKLGGVTVSTIADPQDTQATPDKARVYAWVTSKDGRFFTYGGKTNNDLHQRFRQPIGVIGYSTTRRLNKAQSSKVYSPTSFRDGTNGFPDGCQIRSSDVLCIKASAKNPNSENEQEVINALWEAEEYVAKKYGRKNLIFNLNTRAEHRTRKYCERTFDECVKVFSKWFAAQYPVASLRAKANAAKAKAKVRKPINVKA